MKIVLAAMRCGRPAVSVCLLLALPLLAFYILPVRSSRLPAEQVAEGGPVRLDPAESALLLTLGLQDTQPTDWDGRLTVEGGRVVSIRNLDSGQLVEGDSWMARTEAVARRRRQRGKATISPVRLAVVLRAPDNARLQLTTPAGRSVFSLESLSYFHATSLLSGAASVMRMPNFVQLTASGTHDDFPAAARGSDGTVWCAYVAYQPGTPVDEMETAAGRFESLRTRGNGDQIRLARYTGGQWSPAINVTGKGLDVWRPAVVTDRDGAPWVVWSQQLDGNWDLYARRFSPADGALGPVMRLTTDAGADINVVAARSSEGQIWLAWQGRRGSNFDIWLGRLTAAGELEAIEQVSTSSANDWSPAIAAGPGGEVWVAWDTYDKGDYDVYARCLRSGKLGPLQPVATSERFEARPGVAVDRQGQPWFAFEDADANWGKDYGPRLTGKGVPFYYQRRILVRTLRDGQLMQTVAAPPSPPIYTHYDDKRYQAEMKQRISLPRLAFDGSGHLWLLYRRHPLPQTASGERWVSFAQYADGATWSGEVPVPNSDNLLDNRPALVPLDGGGLLAVYSTDGRTSGTRSAKINDLYAAVLKVQRQPSPIELAAVPAAGRGRKVPPADPEETENVRRCRQWRIEAGGKTYRLLRGEFHRHTEISAHRDWDGPMEEMWRYGLDVAAMDWIGPGDHDYGVGLEYMWWLTQKQIDLYYAPGQFLPMYTYERSVSYPSGHRNVMFAQRGIRPLPHLPGRENTFGTPEEGAPDIANLYRYLKYFGGICSSHTSATNMGTDWRNSDAEVEPVVEIFQGHRQNYEEPGAPLAAKGPEDSIQGYRPAGFVWEAFKKGIRLGFQSSSDHVSTHTSYTFVLAEEPTRRGLIDALKKRHCYAANDNIILDVRCGEHLMGDQFQLAARPQLDIEVVATAPIKKLDIIRQVDRQVPAYVYSIEPDKRQLKFHWRDDAAVAGPLMYYVRIEQTDGRLAWSSPMWITYRP